MNGKRHGKGIFTYVDGSNYEGDYKHDFKNGKGIYTKSNGIKYEGDSKDDKLDTKFLNLIID